MFVKLKDSMEGIQCKMKEFSQCVQENGNDENRKDKHGGPNQVSNNQLIKNSRTS